MARRLTGNVQVGGEWYGPDYGNADTVPDEVAEKIGDHMWESLPAGVVDVELPAQIVPKVTRGRKPRGQS